MSAPLYNLLEIKDLVSPSDYKLCFDAFYSDHEHINVELAQSDIAKRFMHHCEYVSYIRETKYS